MAGLQQKKIKDSYKSLLRVDDDTHGIDGALANITDGEGTTGPFQISQTEVAFTAGSTLKVSSIKQSIATEGFHLNLTDSNSNNLNLLSIPDDRDGAFIIQEGSNQYMKFATTNGSEVVEFGKDVEMQGNLQVNGTIIGDINFDSNTLFIDDSANSVGIGTNSPSSGLHLQGGDNTASKITLTNTAPTPDNVWSIHPQYNDQTLRFLGDSTTVLTMKDTGQVGIGTTSPATATNVLLTVGDTSLGYAGMEIRGGTNAESWRLYSSFDGNNDAIFGLFRVADGSYKFQVGESGDATFAGNVVINKASNPTYLQIGSSLADDPYMVFQSDGNTFAMGIDRSDSNRFKISDNTTLGTFDRFEIDATGLNIFRYTGAENTVQIHSGTGSATTGVSQIYFSSKDQYGGNTHQSYIKSTIDGSSSTSATKMTFHNRKSDGTVYEYMSINNEGRTEIEGQQGGTLRLTSQKTSIGGTDPLGTIQFRSRDSDNDGTLATISTIMARPNATHTTNITGETGEHTEMIFRLGDDTGSGIEQNMKETLRLRGDEGNFAASIDAHGAYGLSINAPDASNSSHDIFTVVNSSGSSVHAMIGDGSYTNSGGMRIKGNALSTGDTGISSSGAGGHLRFFVNGSEKTSLRTNGSYKHQGGGSDIGATHYKHGTTSSNGLAVSFDITLNSPSTLWTSVVCELLITTIGNSHPTASSIYLIEIEHHSAPVFTIATPVNIGGTASQSISTSNSGTNVAQIRINGQGGSTSNVGAFLRVVSGVTGVSSIT